MSAFGGTLHLPKRDPTRSDRQIAKAAGVSQPTVSATRHALEASGDVKEVITSTGADGKTYPREGYELHAIKSTSERRFIARYDDPAAARAAAAWFRFYGAVVEVVPVLNRDEAEA